MKRGKEKMDMKNMSLIVFAFVALAAVMSFIYVLGEPAETNTPTGQLSGSQIYASSWYKVMNDGEDVCTKRFSCRGRPGIFLDYDPARDMFLCGCEVNEFTGWRSRIYIYG